MAKKITPYEQAPYQQGYEQAKAKEKCNNPYLKLEDAEADADDFQRGYDNAIEALEQE
jgi:hypothetical protein